MVEGETYASIDLGSQGFKVIIVEKQANNKIAVKDFFKAPSKGISRGEIIDTQECYNSLYETIIRIEKKVHSFRVNISSPSLQYKYTSGGMLISGKVSADDVEKAMDSSEDYSYALSQNMEYERHPHKFKVGHSTFSKQVVGVKTNHLQVYYSLFYFDKSITSKIYEVFSDTKINTEDEIVSSVALGNFLLTAEQKNDGVCLLDIGHQVCDVIVFKDGEIKFGQTINFAGVNISEDIAYNYDCSLLEAERLKKEHGFININNANEEALIKFKQFDEEKFLSNYQLAEVIEQSLRQLFTQIKTTLSENNLKSLSSGFVITGGSSKLVGLVDLARTIFKNKVMLAHTSNDFLEKNDIQFNCQNKELVDYCLALSLVMYTRDTSHLQKLTTVEQKNTNFIKKFSNTFKSIL